MRAARILIVLAMLIQPALAQDTLPDKAVYQAMLDANRKTGWVQFRNFAGQQWLYFTPLQTMHCRLSAIRYSINSMALDRTFPLLPCNSQLPFSLPSDAGVDAIAVTLSPGTARNVAVQAVWKDGTATDVMVYAPCDDVGESACAREIPQP